MNLVDVLAVGAHPDDIELGCGGLLCVLKARGHRFALLDLTAGENGSRGNAATRAAEAKAAAESLGASGRECLGLPDTAVADTDRAVRLMVEQLRKWRPKLVIAQDEGDQHPDHAAGARIVRRALFLAALANYLAAGEPHRVARLIRYSRHTFFRPDFVVDISDHVEAKLSAVRCYASQFTRTEPGAKTPISEPGYEDDLKAAWRFWGQDAGALFAEPFAMDGIPQISDPVHDLCIQRRDVQ
ncbi:MAG: bacillithiol biosynthesis deacetylase BshB1 [Planctomycetota bacterium]